MEPQVRTDGGSGSSMESVFGPNGKSRTSCTSSSESEMNQSCSITMQEEEEDEKKDENQIVPNVSLGRTHSPVEYKDFGSQKRKDIHRGSGTERVNIEWAGPLLGTRQLEKYLPEKMASIQVTTWNMGSLPLPNEHQLSKLFHHEFDKLKNIDVHVVAIQECWPDVDAWEMELQMCLGCEFALFHSVSYGTLHLSVFLRRDLLWFTTEPSDSTLTVRSGRLFKTKGCAGIYFGLFGSKFLFINAHLSAGEGREREDQRIEELIKILIHCEKANEQEHYDAVFLCGDLNFRITQHRRVDIYEHVRKCNFTTLLETDQLTRLFMRSTSKALKGFQEAAFITFRPTYKYDLGTDNFDTSNKKRAPAYTDRIIFKSATLPSGTPVASCMAYEAVFSLRVSDHRPVYAIFHCRIRPGFDTLPITGARYKRELYVKAVQKQAKFLLDRRKKLASNVCCVS